MGQFLEDISQRRENRKMGDLNPEITQIVVELFERFILGYIPILRLPDGLMNKTISLPGATRQRALRNSESRAALWHEVGFD
jgi:hypothetical protein